MIPKGIMGWSTEVSVVARDALDENVRRDAKIVMPEEQIPPVKMPLTHQAALKSPLVAVSSRLSQKLIDAGIRVHTVGADRVTSSFYYIAEGGGEETVRVEGDLVGAVGSMLGERADNAAIERVLDGLVDRLLRSLSKDRVAELSLELAAALPRAAADGSGMQDIDLQSFEKELASLVGTSEKYTPFLKEIAAKISDTNDRKVDIPLFGDARKVSQGPFELMVGAQKVSLVTHERWLATGPLTEPTKAAPAPAPVVQKSPAPAPVVQKAAEPKSEPKPAPKLQASPAPAPVAVSSPPANMRPLAAPIHPPRPGSNPPPPAAKEIAPTPVVAVQPTPIAQVSAPAPAPVVEAPKPEPAPEPAPPKAAPAPEPRPAPAPEPVVAKAEPTKVEPAPTPAPAATKEPDPSPIVKAKAVEPVKKTPSKPPKVADEEVALPAVPVKKGGIPWLWILVLAAAAFAGYRLLGRH
jgi:hypothetical protein